MLSHGSRQKRRFEFFPSEMTSGSGIGHRADESAQILPRRGCRKVFQDLDADEVEYHRWGCRDRCLLGGDHTSNDVDI